MRVLSLRCSAWTKYILLPQTKGNNLINQSIRNLTVVFCHLLLMDEISYLFICLWLYSSLSDLGRFFSFLIPYTVGRTPWTGDQPVARLLPTHRTTQKRNKRTQTSIPWVGFEHTIPAFERAKRVYALSNCDRRLSTYSLHKRNQYIGHHVI
jgi:hypothetical protein